MLEEARRHTPRFSQELFPEKRSTLHVATQHAALAVAARCIGLRSVLHTSSQRPALNGASFCSAHCIHIHEGVNPARFYPTECYKAFWRQMYSAQKRQ